MPEATYAAAYTLATTPAFINQVQIALTVTGNNIIATGDFPSINLYCFGRDPSAAARVALRIADSMPGLTPNDATVQAAVDPLIPTSGAFVL